MGGHKELPTQVTNTERWIEILCYMGGHKDKLDTKINGLQKYAYLSGINNKIAQTFYKCHDKHCLNVFC